MYEIWPIKQTTEILTTSDPLPSGVEAGVETPTVTLERLPIL